MTESVVEPVPFESTSDIPAWFAAGWRDPGALDDFCAHFLPGFDPEATFIQPLAPTSSGHGSFRLIFARLFATFPDLRAEVIRSSTTASEVFLELDLTATLGRRTVQWQTIDRLTVRGGLITERRSYFDSRPVVSAVTRHPGSWAGVLRRTTRATPPMRG